MKNTKTVLMTIIAAAMFSTGHVLAEQDGLVDVDIRNIANDIAQSINVSVGKIPSAVRVRVNVATHTCQVPEAILAEQEKGGGAKCVAKMTSPDLERIVDRQIKGVTH